MSDRLSLMIVDDEKPMLEWLSILLEEQGFRVSCHDSGESALEAAGEDPPDVLVVDVKMPGMSGFEVLSRMREIAPDLVGIMMTAFSSVDSAVEAMRKGASDYLVKPFKVDQLLVAVEKALKEKSIRKENADLKKKVGARFSTEAILGKSRPILELLEKVRRVAVTDSTVLITGESGSGKELVARAIHGGSPRSDGPFLGVNCGSFSRELLASELFGHVRGAFTGAHKDKEGLLVAAEGGTFFLDEVGELPRDLQVKLLRALQERKVLPVGGTRLVPFNTRIIAATNSDLAAMVKNGEFRADLYYRLNVIPIHVPPLRERKSDIPFLVKKFLEDYASGVGARHKTISDEAMEILVEYHWPGNVRELENVVERLCVMSRGEVIGPEDVPGYMRKAGKTAAPPERGTAGFMEGMAPTLEEVEKAYVLYVLEHRAGGRKRLAAKMLGVNESTLYRKLEKYSAGEEER